ncbi:BC1872 family protein [Alicyclobacillus acidoterrestris]|uniref:Phage ABA sandwich domain-containing protein n=1 Tax=Alicyclobacillus acidoterrestris (strain ATCC 49025 / DSM 3922 / CIP 106132 / NCIMB 13137 / GD3B) TaxID=1356854 RepID=T0D8A1_ALIAG|nr:hypothetical protein [Alicyclobacillus acidoterrestris]EPZ47737.1 hypothetical protein N007_05640 [Alicyclobacillus acidoterrestris ATCC 49025]UNO47955.1 hypothetical protein K1I37_14870 [Alicyclobacillus acidoterrestris]
MPQYDWETMTFEEKHHLLAEKVMEWTVGEHPELHGTGQMMVEYEEPVYFRQDGTFLCECEWYPTEDISAAWEVVEKMKQDGWLPSIEYFEKAIRKGYEVTMGHMSEDAQWAISETAPEAICLAALRAKGVDV